MLTVRGRYIRQRVIETLVIFKPKKERQVMILYDTNLRMLLRRSITVFSRSRCDGSYLMVWETSPATELILINHIRFGREGVQ